MGFERYRSFDSDEAPPSSLEEASISVSNGLVDSVGACMPGGEWVLLDVFNPTGQEPQRTLSETFEARVPNSVVASLARTCAFKDSSCASS